MFILSEQLQKMRLLLLGEIITYVLSCAIFLRVVKKTNNNSNNKNSLVEILLVYWGWTGFGQFVAMELKLNS